MMLVSSKKELEIALSSTMVFRRPREDLEQYITPSSVAAEILWEAFMRGSIVNRTVADLGCGTMRLGYGALLLGSARVVGVDIDCSVVEEAYAWARGESLGHRILAVCGDVRHIQLRGLDTVVMNPPFGVKPGNRGLDLVFLRRALEQARDVYSIHKDSPGLRRLIQGLAELFNSRVLFIKSVRYPIGMVFPRHRRRVHWVNTVIVGLRRMEGAMG